METGGFPAFAGAGVRGLHTKVTVVAAGDF